MYGILNSIANESYEIFMARLASYIYSDNLWLLQWYYDSCYTCARFRIDGILRNTSGLWRWPYLALASTHVLHVTLRTRTDYRTTLNAQNNVSLSFFFLFFPSHCTFLLHIKEKIILENEQNLLFKKKIDCFS